MLSDSTKIPDDIKGALDGSSVYSGPEQVVIDLTNRCNNNCIACWTGSPLLRDKTPGDHFNSLEFPFELMLEIISDLHRLGTKRIRFSGGGEPFMHPNLMALIQEIKSLGMVCCMTTNFTLINEGMIRKLIEYELDEIAVSLWAADPVTYSRVHPNKTEKTFKRIEGLLLQLGNKKKVLPRATIANVLFNMNYQNAMQMFEFAGRVKADAIYYTLVDPIQDYTDSLLLTQEQSNELFEILEQIEIRAQNQMAGKKIDLENFKQLKRRLSNPDKDRGLYDSNIINSIPCYIGWMFCRLLPNGDVSPCCRGVNKPMGNLFEQSFEEIWNSKAYQEFRYNAKNFNKNHPYFHPISCDSTCDNLMHNLDMHKRVMEICPEIGQELVLIK